MIITIRYWLALFAIASVVVVAGCGPRPLGDPQPLVPAELKRDRILGADDEWLGLTTWTPRGRPKAIILALHGYGDSGETTFSGAASTWARHGILTYAYDQRGFGTNPSRRQWPGPQILEADAQAIAAAIRERHPGVPLTLVGHSMGGGVTLAAAGRGIDADRLVLVAPAIAGGDALDPVRRLGGWSLGVFAANRRFTGDGVVTLSPTDNRDALREVARGQAHFADPSGRELWGLVQVMDRAAAVAEDVPQPTLVLMGAQDEFLPQRGVRRVADRIPDHSFVSYPEGWHWLLRDLQAPTVWQDIADFALKGSVPGP